ncbi:MAG: hypothetical protein JRC99_00105 [Deltaproteobacteria bacterium]|nr:hypothetical protein [Deltaproteobacteria bacterium]
MELTEEEREMILAKRLEDAAAKCPSMPFDVLDNIIRLAESGPACRDSGRSIKCSIAEQSAAWGFCQQEK